MKGIKHVFLDKFMLTSRGDEGHELMRGLFSDSGFNRVVAIIRTLDDWWPI